ncbi:MAG: nitrile hydratase subunit alpha [Stellaceae bacterium]
MVQNGYITEAELEARTQQILINPAAARKTGGDPARDHHQQYGKQRSGVPRDSDGSVQRRQDRRQGVGRSGLQADALGDDTPGAIAEMDLTKGMTGAEGENMRAVANSPQLHNLIICTLCSCYPRRIAGQHDSRAQRGAVGHARLLSACGRKVNSSLVAGHDTMTALLVS